MIFIYTLIYSIFLKQFKKKPIGGAKCTCRLIHVLPSIKKSELFLVLSLKRQYNLLISISEVVSIGS